MRDATVILAACMNLEAGGRMAGQQGGHCSGAASAFLWCIPALGLEGYWACSALFDMEGVCAGRRPHGRLRVPEALHSMSY